MPDSTTPTDLVLTYSVNPDGKSANTEALDAALAAGYRLLDVLPVASEATVFVTVVLTRDVSRTGGPGGSVYKHWLGHGSKK